MDRDESGSPVRVDAHGIMGDATHVSLDGRALGRLSGYLIDEYEFTLPSWEAPVYPSVESDSLETVVDFFIVANSLNYCFNDLDTGEKFAVSHLNSQWRGAYGMFAALDRALRNDIPILDATYLKDVTLSDVEEIFEPGNGVSLPMLESRVTQLNTVGALMEAFGGTFRELFSGDIMLYGEDGVVEWLANTAPFEDVSTYRYRAVRFDKRAQLAVSMLYGKLAGTEHAFDILDMEEFTVFADYGIPAGLASHGAIVYSDELRNQIEQGIEIDSGSEEEIEIRAATVVAGDVIQTVLEDQYDQEVAVPVLDYVLWQMRTDADTNQHLTETTAY